MKIVVRIADVIALAKRFELAPVSPRPPESIQPAAGTATSSASAPQLIVSEIPSTNARAFWDGSVERTKAMY